MTEFAPDFGPRSTPDSKMRTSFELQAKHAIEAEGFRVLRSGWPDFAVMDGRRLCCLLEIKDQWDRIRPNQSAMHEALYQLGKPIHIVRPWELAGIIAGLVKDKQVHTDFLESVRRRRPLAEPGEVG